MYSTEKEKKGGKSSFCLKQGGGSGRRENGQKSTTWQKKDGIATMIL